MYSDAIDGNNLEKNIGEKFGKNISFHFINSI